MHESVIEPIGDADREAVRSFLRERWGDETMAVHDTLYRPAELDGFAAWRNGAMIGLATFRIDGDGCEIVTLDSAVEGRGIGTALIRAVEAAAASSGRNRVWLMTTNDNVDALGFYQRRGYRIVRIDPGAVERARRLKPSIPAIGGHGIPIRDEIELEKRSLAQAM